MGRDYVTIREEQHDGQTIMVETTVGHMLLKSAPGRIVQRNGHYQIDGMAWGPAVAAVEVKIDNRPWIKATLQSKSEYTWRFWHLDHRSRWRAYCDVASDRHGRQGTASDG